MLSTWGCHDTQADPPPSPPTPPPLLRTQAGHLIRPAENQAAETHSLLTPIPCVDRPVYENTRILQTLNTAEGDASRTDIL